MLLNNGQCLNYDCELRNSFGYCSVTACTKQVAYSTGTTCKVGETMTFPTEIDGIHFENIEELTLYIKQTQNNND